MVLEIMKGISLALKSAFGDGVEVYFSNDEQQGLKEPCFVLSVESSSCTKRIGNRYRQRNSFHVEYHPGEKPGDSEQMFDTEIIKVAEQIFNVLEFIQLDGGDLIHATAISYRIVEGLLHFSADFNLFLKKESETEEMETVEINTIQGKTKQKG